MGPEDLPYSKELEENFRRIALSEGDMPSLNDLFKIMQLWFDKEGLLLNKFYEESSDLYDESTLDLAQNNMRIAIEKVTKNYLENPEENPQAIVGLFRTKGSGRGPLYNIITYFWLEGEPAESGLETFLTIHNPFRIDIHDGKPPEHTIPTTDPNSPLSVEDMVEFWGFNTDELYGDECKIILSTLTADALRIIETFWFGLLNWQSFPERFLED